MNQNQFYLKTFLLFVITFNSTNIIYSQMSENKKHNLIAKGAVLTKLSDQYSFTEGPVADKKGNVFFTDQPNNKIWKYNTADGKLAVFKDGASRPNGMF